MYISNSRYRRRQPPHPHGQRGVAAVFAAVFMVAAVAALALAVDVGHLYSAQTKLQSAAEIAAIEAARAALGCGGDVNDPQAAALAAAQNAVARNYSDRQDSNLPTVAVPVLGGVVDATDDDDNATGLRNFVANGGLAGAGLPAGLTAEDLRNTAVRVNLTDPEEPGLFLPSGNPLTAQAAAQNTPIAAFSLGSGLLHLDPDFLGPLGIDVGVFDQGALVDATVSLGELAAELGVATPNDLLTTSLPVGDLIDALNTVSDGALAGLQNALESNLGDTVVTLGDIIASTGDLGQQVQANAVPIADALIQAALAERGEAVTLPLDINVLGLADATAQVSILEPPQVAVGRPGLDSQGDPRTEARSGAVQVQLDLDLNIDLGAASIIGDLPIYIRSGAATAQLQSIDCADSQQNFHEVAIAAQTGTGTIGLGSFDDITQSGSPTTTGASLDLDAVNSLIPLLGINANANPPINLGSAEADPLMPLFEHPPAPGDDNTREFSGGLQLGGAVSGLVGNLSVEIDPDSLAGLGFLVAPLVNTLLGNVQGLLQPAVANLLQNVLVLDPTVNSLLAGLGVELGTAEVRLDGVDADRAELVEN